MLLLLTSPPRTLRAVGGGSAAGPSHSRHFAATQQFGRFRSEADIERFSVCTEPVAFDPEQKSSQGRYPIVSRSSFGSSQPSRCGFQPTRNIPNALRQQNCPFVIILMLCPEPYRAQSRSFYGDDLKEPG